MNTYPSKLSNYIINDRLLLSVAPRAGHHNLKWFIMCLKLDGRIKIESTAQIRDPERFYKIKLIRNPYHRAVSTFCMFCGCPDNKLFANPPFKYTHQEAMKLSFKQFINSLKRLDLNTLNHHISSQLDYYENVHYKYDEFIKTEDSKTMLPLVIDKLGIDKINLSIFNPVAGGGKGYNIKSKFRYDKKIFTMSYEDILTLVKNNNYNWPTYESYYDNKLKSLVAKIYRADLHDYDIEV